MKIPKKAKRVFAGIVYDVYQWKETNFDGTPATFEAVKRHDSVQIMPTTRKKVFVGREEQPGRKPFYSFFGGRVEKGETPLAAAKRELAEESGMVSDDWVLIETYHVPGRIEWRVHYYVARNARAAHKQQLDPGERIMVMPVSFTKFIKLLAHPEFRGTERVRLWLTGGLDRTKLAAFKKKLLG